MKLILFEEMFTQTYVEKYSVWEYTNVNERNKVKDIQKQLYFFYSKS